MELERKIYSSWAFSKNAEEKRDINEDIYQELTKKYKVLRTIWDITQRNVDEYDVVISRNACYLHSEYIVIKNKPNLSIDELALLCDQGNLCFGYEYEGNNRFCVFED